MQDFIAYGLGVRRVGVTLRRACCSECHRGDLAVTGAPVPT
jgi:hypothetical protein